MDAEKTYIFGIFVRVQDFKERSLLVVVVQNTGVHFFNYSSLTSRFLNYSRCLKFENYKTVSYLDLPAHLPKSVDDSEPL
jgi:hypothetical protein